MKRTYRLENYGWDDPDELELELHEWFEVLGVSIQTSFDGRFVVIKCDVTDEIDEKYQKFWNDLEAVAFIKGLFSEKLEGI